MKSSVNAMNTISLLIPTHNRVEQLLVTLQSIEKQLVSDARLIEVIVVANGCKDNTIDVVNGKIRSFPFTLRLFDEQQLGLPHARNRAIKEAGHEIMAFIDDDVVLAENYLQSMLDCYANNPADLVGGKTELLWEAVDRPDWLPDELLGLLSCKDLGDATKEVFLQSDAIGCNFSFHKRVLEKIGGFKIGLGRSGKLLIGGEETEFIYRALRDEFRMFYEPKCFLHHWVAPNRPTVKYLTGVANGNAVGFVFAKPRFGIFKAGKWTVFHTYKLIEHTLKEFLSRLQGNSRNSIFHKIRKHSQIGFLKGVFLRITGRVKIQN